TSIRKLFVISLATLFPTFDNCTAIATTSIIRGIGTICTVSRTALVARQFPSASTTQARSTMAKKAAKATTPAKPTTRRARPATTRAAKTTAVASPEAPLTTKTQPVVPVPGVATKLKFRLYNFLAQERGYYLAEPFRRERPPEDIPAKSLAHSI